MNLKSDNIKNILDIIFMSIAAGLAIGIGGTVFLSCENRYFGAFIFAVGLVSIVVFKMNLYTGKVGYLLENKPSYALKVLTVLFGNAVGTFTVAQALRFTRIYPAISEKVSAVCLIKEGDDALSSFILAVFCGLLMYIAVDGYKRCAENKAHTLSVFVLIMPVITFILVGFNHSVADMFYMFLDGLTVDKAIYLAVVVIGNAVGGLIIPVLSIFKTASK